MIRAVFKVLSSDPRPVSWPIPHPYWHTGTWYDDYPDKDRGSGACIVAYADDVQQLKTLWPDLFALESDDVQDYVFTERFPRPDWFTDKSEN